MSLPVASMSAPLFGGFAPNVDSHRAEIVLDDAPIRELGRTVHGMDESDAGGILDALARQRDALRLVLEAERVGAASLPESLKRVVCAVLGTGLLNG